MIYLGQFVAGDSVFYAANFHDDSGTIADPTSPEAQIRNPAGTWSALTTPAKQNSKTGHFGGTIDTTGYANGQFTIRMAGTVATAKTVATEFGFSVIAAQQSGDSFAVVKSGGTGDNAAIKAKTDNLPASPASTTNITAGTITTVTNLTNAPTNGDLTSTMKTSVATAALVTQVTESYRANGAAPTLAQALCELIAHAAEASVSGTTKTIKKLDHTTTAETFTLDSATAPTSITRAT